MKYLNNLSAEFADYADTVDSLLEKPHLMTAVTSHIQKRSSLHKSVVAEYVKARFADSVCRLPDDFIKSIEVKSLWHHLWGLSQTTTGYGLKLASEYVINCADKRQRRVYYDCLSNCASFYILVNNYRFYVSDYQLGQVKK